MFITDQANGHYRAGKEVDRQQPDYQYSNRTRHQDPVELRQGPKVGLGHLSGFPPGQAFLAASITGRRLGVRTQGTQAQRRVVFSAMGCDMGRSSMTLTAEGLRTLRKIHYYHRDTAHTRALLLSRLCQGGGRVRLSVCGYRCRCRMSPCGFRFEKR